MRVYPPILLASEWTDVGLLDIRVSYIDGWNGAT